MKQLRKDEIIAYLQEIKPQLQSVGIDRIGLFGSVARENHDLLSDIDIMIHTTPAFVSRFKGVNAFLYLDTLRQEIGRKFGRSVDICDEAGLKKKIEGVIYA